MFDCLLWGSFFVIPTPGFEARGGRRFSITQSHWSGRLICVLVAQSSGAQHGSARAHLGAAAAALRLGRRRHAQVRHGAGPAAQDARPAAPAAAAAPRRLLLLLRRRRLVFLRRRRTPLAQRFGLVSQPRLPLNCVGKNPLGVARHPCESDSK